MKPALAWLVSGSIVALVALAVTTTLLGNRGDEDSAGGWTGGHAPLLAFLAGAGPMGLAHAIVFRWLRPRDALPLRMVRAAGAGLLAFALAMAGLIALAREA